MTVAYGNPFISGDARYLKLDQTTPQSVINGVPYIVNGIKTPKIYPNADSTTAVQINKADGTTNVLNVDTTNERVGIGVVAPTARLQLAASTIPSGGISFGGDTNLYRGAAGYLFSSSNLRIGDITFNVELNNGISVNASGSTMRFVHDGTAGYFGTMDALPLHIITEEQIVATFLSGGNVGIGLTSPTAYLHLKAGTAAALTAPQKYTEGINNTNPEPGAVEWDGTNLFITQTIGPTRKTIAYTTDLHTRQHSLQSTSDHTGTGTANYVMKAGANGLPSNSIIFDNGTIVGIGTTAPAGKLQVENAGNALRINTTGGSSTALLLNNAGSGSAMRVSNTDFAGTDLFIINNAGNVGIGTTSPTAYLHLKAGTATAGTAPLKFTSGTLLGTAEVGVIEFLTDDIYTTITTGAARKKIVLDNGTDLVSGDIPYVTTNGRLASQTPVADGTYTVGKGAVTDGTITITNGIITAIQEASD